MAEIIDFVSDIHCNTSSFPFTGNADYGIRLRTSLKIEAQPLLRQKSPLEPSPHQKSTAVNPQCAAMGKDRTKCSVHCPVLSTDTIKKHL